MATGRFASCTCWRAGVGRRRSGPDRQHPRRVVDEQAVDLRLGHADVEQHRHEPGQQVAVADPAEPLEVLREADVLRDQQPVAEPGVDDRLDVPRPLLVGLEVAEPDVVDLDVDAALEQAQLMVDVALVAVVADDDPVRRDALLEQDGDLLRPEPAGPLAVGADRDAGLALCPRGRPEDALLGRAQEVDLGPDLADDPRPDAGPVDAVDDIADRAGRPARRRSSARCSPGRPAGGTSRRP